MRTGVTSLVFLAILAAQVKAQYPHPRIFTNPTPPSRDALDRLNLQTSWRFYVPVEGRGDGLFSAQFDEKDFFVQSINGLIVCVDVDTGRERWRTKSRAVARPSHGLGFNTTMAFTVNGAFISAFDRANGNLLWDFPLPSVASAAPVADDRQVYLTLGSKTIMTYLIAGAMPGRDKGSPGASATPSTNEAEKKYRGISLRERPSIFERGSRTLASVGPLNSAADVSRFFADSDAPLILAGGKVTHHSVEETPLQINDSLLFPCADGGAISVAKVQPVEMFFFPTKGPVTAAAGQYRETAFLGSHDHNLTSLSMVSGKVLWQFPGPAPFLRRPHVNDEAVFVTPERSGLYKLGRTTGDVVWNNRQAERFLAANPKFVYAFDSSGNLMVLDRKRGTMLSGLNTLDFVFPIPNETTDRLFLGAHNGLVVCLHDKEFRTPFVMKTPEPPPEKLEDKFK